MTAGNRGRFKPGPDLRRSGFTCEANPACPNCGERSIKNGFVKDRQQYLCQGEDGRRFYWPHTPAPSPLLNPHCVKCRTYMAKAYKKRNGVQYYQCRKCRVRVASRKGKIGRPANQPARITEIAPEIREAQQIRNRATADLLEIIERAVAHLPSWIREDVSQEMILAALDGEFDLSEVSRAVAVYRRKTNHLSANKFKFASLAQVIPNTNGLTIGDTLAG